MGSPVSAARSRSLLGPRARRPASSRRRWSGVSSEGCKSGRGSDRMGRLRKECPQRRPRGGGPAVGRCEREKPYSVIPTKLHFTEENCVRNDITDRARVPERHRFYTSGQGDSEAKGISRQLLADGNSPDRNPDRRRAGHRHLIASAWPLLGHSFRERRCLALSKWNSNFFKSFLYGSAPATGKV